MPSDLYFMRHGESEANIRGVLCGSRTNPSLSECGVTQVQEAARSIPFVKGVIISSPLKRARETAEIIIKANPDFSLEIWDELVEQDYGDWENRRFMEIKESFLSGVNPPNGETSDHFKERMKSLSQKMKTLSLNAIFVSHGGVGSELLESFNQKKRLISNAEIIQLRTMP